MGFEGSYVGLDQVRAAATVLEDVAVHTPVEISRVLSDLAGGLTFLKCENLQRTGAFKIRGAYNRIARLSEEERARGVVAASAGNHAQGVALGASMLGVRSTVFMPAGAPIPKIEATSRYGAKVVLEGAVYDEAASAAEAYCEAQGAVMVHPFDHPDVIAGQGTIALEILEQMPDVASIVVPVGGGGLISGIAAATKALRPGVRVIGVEADGAAAVSHSLAAGHAVTLETCSTIADGLATKAVGELTLPHIERFVDDVVTVKEEDLAESVLLMAERAKLVVEPAGAAGVAAAMTRQGGLVFPAVVLLSGGNIDPLLLVRVLSFGMGAGGRYFSFRTRLHDRPGELHKLSGVISQAGANIVGVEHRREGAQFRKFGQVEISIQAETAGRDHVERLRTALEAADYTLEEL
jgi:threonine dehydratase